MPSIIAVAQANAGSTGRQWSIIAHRKTVNTVHKARETSQDINRNQGQASVYEASCSENIVYQPQEASSVQPATGRVAMLKLRNSGNYMKFQLDTGAECNVVWLHLYEKATGDVKLSNVTWPM